MITPAKSDVEKMQETLRDVVSRLDLNEKTISQLGEIFLSKTDLSKLGEKDYRGLLSLGFTGVFAGLSALALFLYGVQGLQAVTAFLGSMEGLIVGFYFAKKG